MLMRSIENAGKSSRRWRFTLAGCGRTLHARRDFIGLHIWDNRSAPRRMLKKARRLTRPAPARRDAPFRGQGRSSAADPRFTPHASRFTAAGSKARTPLADFFSILLASASDSMALLGAPPRSNQSGAVQSEAMRCLVSKDEASGDATACLKPVDP